MSKRICIFGSSITRGSNDFKKLGWAERLKFDLLKKDEYAIYNLAVSGHSTNNLLEYLDIDCKTRNPETVIVGLGMNDSSCRKNLKGNLVDFNIFKDNLNKIKEIAKKYTDNIIFIGLFKVDEKKTTPIPWGKDVYYRNKSVLKYELALKEFCKENNLLFIELFNLLDNSDLDDGLHPNTKGHEKMYKKIKQSLIDNNIIN